MRALIFVCSILFLASVNLGQNKRLKSVPPDSARNEMTIVTKVPFNGTNYFIKIVPMDSSKHYSMPVYSGGQKGVVIFWGDSLQRLLPDSVLRYLNQKNMKLKQP